MAEHLRLEQPEWDGTEWKEVDVENGMDAQQEWVVTLWTEAEPAAFVEGVGYGMRLEWQAVAVVDSETEGRNYWDNCQSLVVGSQGSSYRSIATTGAWLLRCEKQVKSFTN